MNRRKRLAVLSAIMILAACIGGFIVPAGADNQLYVENEWNFADGSMDVSGGIPENASGVLDRIRRNGVLRVATEYPDPEGAEMKLAARIAERMGVKLEIIPADYMQVLPALSEDQCDLTISAVAFTPGRASAYTLSKGYYYPDNGSVTGFVVKEEHKEFYTSKADLEDKVLIARSNSLQEALTAEEVHSYKEFRRVSSIQTVFEAVQYGKADAGVMDLETARNYIESHPDCGLAVVEGFTLQPNQHYLGYRAAAKKGEVQLMYFVNGVIDEVLESGEYLKWNGDAQ